MITEDEYLTAAKVLREEFQLERWAELRAQWTRAIETLGVALEDGMDPRTSSAVNGMKAYTTLVRLGWTPPEGLGWAR